MHIMAESITNEQLYQELLNIKIELRNYIEVSESRILSTIKELKGKIIKLEEENNTLTSRIEFIERDSKNKNIVIHGLKKREKDISAVDLCDDINQLLGLRITVADVGNFYFLGRSQNCPLKIEFVSQIRNLILQKAKLLKDTNISIQRDLTKYQQQEQKTLRHHLKKERVNPNNKSYIKGNKLYVNNKSYTVQELESSGDLIVGEPNSTSATSNSSNSNHLRSQKSVEEEEVFVGLRGLSEDRATLAVTRDSRERGKLKDADELGSAPESIKKNKLQAGVQRIKLRSNK